MNNQNVLLRNYYINIPSCNESSSKEEICTIISNLAYYGYDLDKPAYIALSKLDSETLASWWQEVEIELKAITGDDLTIDEFVVYKNFPAEVLNKSEAQYWFSQILMYIGFDNKYFTEDVADRSELKEKTNKKILKLSNDSTLQEIFNNLLALPTRFKDFELQDVIFLLSCCTLNVEKIKFKENLINLFKHLIDIGKVDIKLNSGTDVLRLAAGLSSEENDLSLREAVKFKSFSKKQRRFLLSLMNKVNNLEDDFARKPDLWKKLVHQLHPGDYKRRYPNVFKLIDPLYKDQLKSFDSKLAFFMTNKDSKALELLSSRPGEFRRRLIHCINVYGIDAVNSFNSIADKLTTFQVVSLKKFLQTLGKRKTAIYPPRGNWTKAKTKVRKPVDKKLVNMVVDCLSEILEKRLPKVHLDSKTRMVKLPSNSEISEFTRGTVFKIPKNVKFIRTASYWEFESNSNIWYDNGWNFFSKDWKSMGSCCWNSIKFRDAAVFSGDPTTSKSEQGKGTQLIDLYLPQLKKAGVKYAVWNILCYSSKCFDDASKVFAALQWGEHSQEGKLFEPSRCQLAFPLTGKNLTKYVCLIDVEDEKLIYLDANLYGKVNSADSNADILEGIMPQYMEYISSLPSIYDLFEKNADKASDINIKYSEYKNSINKINKFLQ